MLNSYNSIIHFFAEYLVDTHMPLVLYFLLNQKEKFMALLYTLNHCVNLKVRNNFHDEPT